MGWGSLCCCPGRLDLLCVLALLGGCLLPVCRTRVYTNHWAVKISGGFAEADRIASKYGFINIGQVRHLGGSGSGGLEDAACGGVCVGGCLWASRGVPSPSARCWSSCC